MKIIRRYIECAVFVTVWMACGWIFRLSNQVYLLLGVQGLVFFQLAIARRPLPQLWVRDSRAFRLDRVGVALAAILTLLPVLTIVKQRDSWERLFPFIAAIIGAAPAAFALRATKHQTASTSFDRLRNGDHNRLRCFRGFCFARWSLASVWPA